MIAQVMRISTVFASMMTTATLALAITIAAAGIAEKTSAGCYGCLHTSTALKGSPAAPVAEASRGMQIAFGAAKSAVVVE